MCLVDRRPELGRTVLRKLGPAARGHVAAARHDLDDVDAALGALAYCGADSVDPGRVLAEEVAVAAGRGDRRPSGEDVRQRRGGGGRPPPTEGEGAPGGPGPPRGH